MDSKTRESLKDDFSTDIKKFTFDIGLCKNDEDRVKLMLNDIDGSFRITPECLYGKKSSRESEEFRYSGNSLLNFSSPDLEEVLKQYSKSILHAPRGSKQLSLAYANRSAILFRGEYYEKCLEDISRALKAGYPDSLKPKLLIRRATCNYALSGNVDFETDAGLIEARELVEKLPATNKMRKMVEDTLNNPEKITSVGRQVKRSLLKYQPEMKGKSPHLPGASDAVALRYSEEFGRHLVATRDIKSGEALLIERPYAIIVPEEWIYCICSHCARSTWNGIPCDYCIYAMFCSAECKHAAWEEYHDVECEVLGIVKTEKITSDVLMGLRITVKAIKEAGTLEALRKRLEKLDSVKVSDVEIPIEPNSYETFYLMSDHPERQELRHLMIFSSIAGRLTYFLAVKTNLFGKKEVGNLQVVKNSENLLFVAALMSKNMRIAINRIFWVKVENKEKTVKDRIIMLLPVCSFLNSRCYDAAELLRFDEDMSLVTPVPISKGDQVFMRYHTNYLMASRDSRRKVLKDHWHFNCNCLACTEDWSSSTSIRNEPEQLLQKIIPKIFDQMKRFEHLSLKKINDPVKLIPLKEDICRFIDYIYSWVKKPCSGVEKFINELNSIYMKLSSTAYPRFIKEF